MYIYYIYIYIYIYILGGGDWTCGGKPDNVEPAPAIPLLTNYQPLHHQQPQQSARTGEITHVYCIHTHMLAHFVTKLYIFMRNQQPQHTARVGEIAEWSGTSGEPTDNSGDAAPGDAAPGLPHHQVG